METKRARGLRRAARAVSISIAVLMAAGCGSGGKSDESSSSRSVKKHAAAKPASVNVLDVPLGGLGGRDRKISDYQGRFLVVTFFSTWNSDCRDIVPMLNHVRYKFQKSLSVIGIAMDGKGPAVVKNYIQANGVKYDVYLGDNATANAFGGARLLPTTYFVLTDGTVFKRLDGLQKQQDYDDMVISMYRLHP
jgi:thiol-disulfide isomerase/thioredoxin